MIEYLDEIFEQDEEKRKLNMNDGKWQNCDYYNLARKNDNLFIRTLDKKFTCDAKEALRNLLLNMLFDQSKYGNKWNITEPFDGNDFERCVKYDFLGFKEVKNITYRFAYKDYRFRFDDFFPDVFSTFEEKVDTDVYVNDKYIGKELIPDMLVSNEIVFAVLLKTEWNENQYFIETHDKWFLISWYAVG